MQNEEKKSRIARSFFILHALRQFLIQNIVNCR